MALRPSNVERTLVVALVALSAAFAPAQAHATGKGTTSRERAGLELTFLGNQGFLLVSGQHKVLVDALVATTHRQYVWQGEVLSGDLAAARPPFDDVDLVLASHVHGDHFDPVAVGRHLTANPRARFVFPPELDVGLFPAWLFDSGQWPGVVGEAVKAQVG